MATTTPRVDTTSSSEHSTSNQETTSWLRTFTDRTGARATVRSFRQQDFKALLEMYYQFEPKRIAQRLPPRTEEQIQRWLTSLTRDGTNFVALVGRHIVGHTVICNLLDGRAELAIFVHQNFQNRGIGSQLIQLAKRAAIAAGYQKIWISVESSNLQAIRFFLKSGFQFTGSFDSESEMILDLISSGRQNAK
jgi:RimJ/RimL family protein N-acetyltransferase